MWVERPVVSITGPDELVEAGSPGTFVITREDDPFPNRDLPVKIDVSGDATPGSDPDGDGISNDDADYVLALPDGTVLGSGEQTVTIPANADHIDLAATPLADSKNEPVEDIQIEIQQPQPGNANFFMAKADGKKKTVTVKGWTVSLDPPRPVAPIGDDPTQAELDELTQLITNAKLDSADQTVRTQSKQRLEQMFIAKPKLIPKADEIAVAANPALNIKSANALWDAEKLVTNPITMSLVENGGKLYLVVTARSPSWTLPGVGGGYPPHDKRTVQTDCSLVWLVVDGEKTAADDRKRNSIPLSVLPGDVATVRYEIVPVREGVTTITATQVFTDSSGGTPPITQSVQQTLTVKDAHP